MPDARKIEILSAFLEYINIKDWDYSIEILHNECGASVGEICELGFDREDVEYVLNIHKYEDEEE